MTDQTTGLLGTNVDVITTATDIIQLGHTLGTTIRHTDGIEYMLVSANGAVVAGDVLLIDTAFDAIPITLTLSATKFGSPIGVSQIAAADNELLWVVRQGNATVRVLASAAANAALNTTATGGALDDDATVGTEIIDGIVLFVANGGSTAATDAFINYPTVGATIV